MDEVVDELPNNEKLPAYDTIASNQPPGYQQTLIISLEDISQVMVDGLRVGSYRDFFIGCCSKWPDLKYTLLILYFCL